MFLDKKVAVILGIVAVIVGIIVVFVVGMKPASAPSIPNFNRFYPNNVEKFQGKVSQPWVSASEDGAQYIEVDGKVLILTDYGDAYSAKSAGEERGAIIGSYSMGTKVEVYAVKIKDNEYSLYGSKQYYVKSLD